MDIEIKKKDGTKYKLSDFGFRVKDVVIESMEIEDNYENKRKHKWSYIIKFTIS